MSLRSLPACANAPDSDILAGRHIPIKSQRIEGRTAMIRGLPIISMVALLTGCVSGPPLQTAVVVGPDKPLKIYGVRTYRDKKGLLVMGTVRRPMLFTGPIWGHLHVVGLFDDRRPPSLSIPDGEHYRPAGVEPHRSALCYRRPTHLRSKVSGSSTETSEIAPSQLNATEQAWRKWTARSGCHETIGRYVWQCFPPASHVIHSFDRPHTFALTNPLVHRTIFPLACG